MAAKNRLTGKTVALPLWERVPSRSEGGEGSLSAEPFDHGPKAQHKLTDALMRATLIDIDDASVQSNVIALTQNVKVN